MGKKYKIRHVTDSDVKSIIDNSVQGATNRLVGNATEQKKMFVRPIANTDNSPSVVGLMEKIVESTEDEINKAWDDTEAAITKLREDTATALDTLEEKTLSVTQFEHEAKAFQPVYDEKLNTESKYVTAAINELHSEVEKNKAVELHVVVSELPEVGEPNKFYLVSKADTEENDLYDEWIWVNKGTKDEPNYVWEFTGAKKFTIDLSEYKKNADFKPLNGLSVDKETGAVYVYYANSRDIYNKKEYRKPIVPYTVNEAVKAGVTDNSLTLSEEEKTSACDWLGALRDSTPLVEDVSANVAENVLTVEIKDKQGNVIASTQVTLPSGGADIDPSEFMKYTDVSTNQGTTMDSGKLSIYPANAAAIEAKKSYRQPIVPAWTDPFIKVGVTTNAETLTDEEKASACEWLGADKKGVLYYSGAIRLVNGVPSSSQTISLGDFNITPRAGDLVITSDGYLYEVFAVYPEGSICTISYLTTLKYTLSESEKTEIKNNVLEALPYYTGEITVEDDA
jgi:hypothetical protein